MFLKTENIGGCAIFSFLESQFRPSFSIMAIGCRKIAHICGSMDVFAAKERALGYEEIFSRNDNFTPSLISQGHFQIEGGYYAMIELLDQHPDLDGVFAGNDLMAAGALRALYKRGKSVPDEVKLIGFDGISTVMAVPEISTIAQPISEMGRLSIQYLLQLIKKEPVEIRNHVLDAKLVVRESTVRILQNNMVRG